MRKTRTDINDLVQGFARNIKQLKAPEYKESQVRLHYIDRFWELLGWDVQNRAQRAPQDLEVLVHPSMDTVDDEGLRSREPDYVFRVNGFARFIVEAKKPSVDIDTDRKGIYQAKRYAWSAVIPFAILTDFEQFRLFDTALKPVLNEPLRGLQSDFRLEHHQYPAQWDVLVATFGRDAVADGSLERLRAQIRKVRPGRRLRTVDRMLIDLKGDEPVDREFLSYLDLHRKHFARHIYRDNRKLFPEADTLHGAAKLTEAVQRLMDRLVFMRVCEDRGIAQWGGLRATLGRIGTEGGDLYAGLCAEFRDLDRAYNGYLFKPHFSEELTVDGGVLSDFIRELYPPDGPWDFSAIADDILGIVYERFLGNVVTVKKHQAEVEEKPEVRHAGGVYYTPRFVVDTIIRRVIGPKMANKTPTELLDVKILDPACGSGSFLVAAFQFLIDHCVRAVGADPGLATIPATPKARKRRKDIAFKDGKGYWHIAPDFKAALLTSCLHGVDIDQQAVEVTVMSLYLKMLEGELPPNWQREWLENELLPPLDNNIRCGNSLIDSTDFDRWCEEENGTLFPLDDQDVRFRINRFDWTSRTRGFGRILDPQAVGQRARAGFDCIIGNPPYVRVQELNKWAPEECEFYKWRYKSAAKGNYDIYVVFTEKALALLAPDGLLGFIMPHKFWQAKYGQGLRRVLAEGRRLRSVVDFTQEQVFPGASIYTAIHVMGGAQNGEASVDVSRIDRLEDGQAQCGALDAGKVADGAARFTARHPASAAPWLLAAPVRREHLLAVDLASTHRLSDIAARMAQGIRTSANPIFVLRCIDRRRRLYFSQAIDRTVELEPTFLRPFLAAQAMRRYQINADEDYVLIPYRLDSSRGAPLVAPQALAEKAPLTWKYLRSFEKELRGREAGKMDHDGWYGFIYPKNLTLIGEPKILVPDIIERPAFSLDSKGGYAFVSGYGIVTKTQYLNHLEYLLGLLNSRLLGGYLKQVSTTLRGGWFRPFPQFMSQIPIKLPETKDEKKLADRIVESVHEIMNAKDKLRAPAPPFAGAKGGLKPAGLSDRERGQLETTVDAHERRIDEAVFALYGVAGLPEG
jgi:hypothetical protein